MRVCSRTRPLAGPPGRRGDSWRHPGGRLLLRLRFSLLPGYAHVTPARDTQGKEDTIMTNEQQPNTEEWAEHPELNQETVQELGEEEFEARRRAFDARCRAAALGPHRIEGLARPPVRPGV